MFNSSSGLCINFIIYTLYYVEGVFASSLLIFEMFKHDDTQIKWSQNVTKFVTLFFPVFMYIM